jgi:dephospho-CoA kinase
MKKLEVGLTGGIASGKSTVGRFFMDFGVAVIDADVLAREVVAKGTPGLAAVIAEFGSEYLMDDGTLDRKKLGQLVFSEVRALPKLNAIVHPLVAVLAAERMRAAQDTPTPYVIYEAAILVETGIYKTFDALIVVAAEPELQLRRVMKRNNLSESEARDRLMVQYPLERKLAVADYVIHNDNDRNALLERTREVHEKLLALSAPV